MRILPALLSLLLSASPLAVGAHPGPAHKHAPLKAKATPKTAPNVVDAPPETPPKAPPRRAVHQIIDGMPPSSYGPRLTPRPPPLVTPSPRPSSSPTAPVQISGCDGGGCTDTNGVRYNNGVGGAVTSPQGRLCSTAGTTVQCF